MKNVPRDRKMPGGFTTRWTWKQQREGAEGGGGKSAVSRFDRAVPQEKTAQGQVDRVPHLMFNSSFRVIVRN